MDTTGEVSRECPAGWLGGGVGEYSICYDGKQKNKNLEPISLSVGHAVGRALLAA